MLTLFVVSSLMAVLAITAATQRTQFLARANRMEAARARLAAEAGIEYALANLTTVLDTNTASTLDDWANIGQFGDEEFVIGRESFRFQILDDSAFININTVTEDHLRRLPMTNEQIDSLLDWREPDQATTRAEGAKDAYYNSLANPYNAKLGRFDSVEELLLVRGFSPQALLLPQTDIVSSTPLVSGDTSQQPALIDILGVDSSSRNINSTGQTRLNVNTINVQQMVQRGIDPAMATAVFQARQRLGNVTSLGQVLREANIPTMQAGPLLDNLGTVGSTNVEGKINVNTASEAVLNSIPGMTNDVTQAILARQDSGGFQELSELLTLPGFSDQVVYDSVGHMTLNTQTFVVRVIGRSGRSVYPFEAIVGFRDSRPVVLKTRRPAFDQVAQRWGWNPQAATTTVLLESQR